MKHISTITYENIPESELYKLESLCNRLMAYQKSKAFIEPERFDIMNYETRLVPSVKGARYNHITIAKDGEEIIGYAYTNICKKETYAGGMFGAFFEMDSVEGDFVGCLSQFYIEDAYRGKGVGHELFNRSMVWLKSFTDVQDYFIFVSNGNQSARDFYESRGFKYSHDILNGFISVLRSHAHAF